MSLDPEAPFAEKLRHEDLRTEEEAAQYITAIWQVRVSEGAVVDYSSFDRAEAAGFPPSALIDDDHERCQAESQWLQDHGARGILSVSAALHGSINLTIFGPKVAVDWNTDPQLASAVPAQRLVHGHPPRGLVGRVRFRGEPHSGFREWQRSRRRQRRRG